MTPAYEMLLGAGEPPASHDKPRGTQASLGPIASAKALGFVRARLDAGRLKLAASEAAWRSRPTDAGAAIALARAYVGLGRFTPALHILQKCFDRGGRRAVLCLDGSMLLLEMGRHDEATRWFAEAVVARPKLARELLRNHQLAMDALGRDAESGVSPRGKARYLEAMELLVQRKFEKAEAAFAKLTKTSPGHVAAWIGWRGALEAQGRLQELAGLERAWRVFSPRTQWAIGASTSRRLSARGLVFDPREALPIRPRGEALERVGSPRDLGKASNAILSLDEGGEPYDLEPVIGLDSAPHQKTRFSYVTAPRYMAVVEGAALVGRGLVVNRDGEVPEELKPCCSLAKAGFEETRGHIVADPLVFRDGLCPVNVFDTPALLMAGPTDSGFGDWVLNFPTRLAIAAAAEVDCPIVVRAGRPESWMRKLVSLGVHPSRIIRHNALDVSVFTRLYVPSWPLPARGRPMKDLFGVYDSPVAPAAGERLYLSREGVAVRKLLNEPEIRAAFERRGFRAIRPEQLTFETAQTLFSEAAVVAGAYGSAFLNLPLHASKPRGVLALMPPGANGFLNEIALWIGGSGSRFAYLFGEGAEGEDDSWTIPIQTVEHALDELLQTVGA